MQVDAYIVMILIIGVSLVIGLGIYYILVLRGDIKELRGSVEFLKTLRKYDM